eukprot:m.14884 g.14884  ORF g.14884 m.14884 type:complete len:238 (-) comp7730_c0_seq1:61-774(-)
MSQTLSAEDRQKLIDIRRVCCLLDQSDSVCACAQYYCQVYLQTARATPGLSLPNLILVATCIYLAGKSQENLRQLRDVVNTTYRIVHPDEPPLMVTPLYEHIRENVVNAELVMLRLLGFKTEYTYPHKVALYLIASLVQEELLLGESVDIQLLSAVASTLLNDSQMLTDLPLTVPSQVLAAASIELACETLEYTVLPLDNDRCGIYRAVLGDDHALLADTKQLLSEMYDNHSAAQVE